MSVFITKELLITQRTLWIVFMIFLIGTLVCREDANAQGRTITGYGPNFQGLIVRQLQFDFDATLSRTFGEDIANVDNTGRRNFFVNPSDLGPIEISKGRRVRHHTKGLAWLVCLQAHPAGEPPKYLTVYIIGKSVVDVRTAVVTDRCPEQTYEPLQWTPHASPQPPSR